MTIICHGLTLTKYPRPCKNKVKVGCLCHLHKDQFVDFYVNPDDTWPRPIEVKTGVLKYNDVRRVIRDINNRLDYKFSNYPDDKLKSKQLFLFTCELIKHNIDLCYHDKRMISLSSLIITRLEEYDFLSDYLLDFKKKCLKSYRELCKKKLIHFYMNHIEGLNLDVVGVIMSFY
jgi:hypothetical protein